MQSRSQPLLGISVNGVAVTLPAPGATCVVDAGTTLIGGPTKDVQCFELFQDLLTWVPRKSGEVWLWT